MDPSATTNDKDKLVKKNTKYSSKLIPEKHISLYSAAEQFDTKPASKYVGRPSSFVESPSADKTNNTSKLKPNHTPSGYGSNNQTYQVNPTSLKSPKVGTPTPIPNNSGSGKPYPTISSKIEATVRKVSITEAQLISPSSNTHKSIGSNQSKNSIKAYSKHDDESIYSKKNNDFKVKYKTEKCKFYDIYKECKYGDNVRIIRITQLVCICSW